MKSLPPFPVTRSEADVLVFLCCSGKAGCFESSSSAIRREASYPGNIPFVSDREKATKQDAFMGLANLPIFIREHYEIHEWKHAIAILQADFPDEWEELVNVLTEFRLHESWLREGGGRKSKISGSIDEALYAKGWAEREFAARLVVDDVVTDSPTHKVDCFKNRVAVEIEWNNKDPFFDRDLNNFRLLFDLRAISVGVIITRCDELQGIVKALGRGSSFGASTTHMAKLLPRLHGGGGGGCPILVFGISKALYVPEKAQ